MIKQHAPVIVFAYNRTDKIKNCMEHIEKCPEASDTELYIFCDGPKTDKDWNDVNKVQEYARQYATSNMFKKVTVTARKENKGLAGSVISGVTEVVNRFGKVIVVEDDLIVLPSFLRFMNEALEYYNDCSICGSVCAFSYPIKGLKDYDKDVYFTCKADCWGWATWADRWNSAAWANPDYNSYLNDRSLRWRFEGLEAGLDRLMYLQYKGKIDSWAVRWVYYLFQEGKLSLYPSRSQVINDGFDGSGTHISGGFGRGFNRDFSEESMDFRWEACELNDKLAHESAKFPRRFFPLYILETAKYMLKRR